jgi:pimeloyl-ACP methyl ester carboxylesterase
MIKLVTQETMLAAGVYVRNKHPAGMTVFSPERTLLFVHGATYASETAFDLRLDGFSWMEYIARRGFDVYFLDVRGYGKSALPLALDQPAESNPPFSDTAGARADVGSAVDYICNDRGIDKVCLLGWSWGCATMGSFAAANPDKVERLVLFAPGWVRTTPSMTDPGGKLGAWREVTREAARARWLAGVPADAVDTLIPPGWFEAWADATFGPEGKLRAPNGVVKDARDYWTAGRAIYDPADITAPTMIAVGEWDNDTPPELARALFPLLVNAPEKRLVLLGGATHTALMERGRMALIEQVQLFLEGGLTPIAG